MSEPSTPGQKLFFELFESLPRQGPGDRATAAQALAFRRQLPAWPAVLDLGCGLGGQSLQLAERTAGTIVAIDRPAPSIARLRAEVAARGLSERLFPRGADMAALDLPPESFELLWSEGALYNLGIAEALGLARRLLRPGDYLDCTEPVWRKGDPPSALRRSFDYPRMGDLAAVLSIIGSSGLALVAHFPLPDQAWWDDLYTPMERRLEALRERYRTDPEALAVLDQLALEPARHRRFSEYYAYEFFVLHRE